MDMHKTSHSRTKVRIQFDSDRATADILDNIEYGFRRVIGDFNDNITRIDVTEIVRTTARPKYLYEAELARRESRAESE